MIKSDKGIVEVDGRGSEILADFGVIYKSIREDFEITDIIDVILFMEKTINDKERINDLLKLFN